MINREQLTDGMKLARDDEPYPVGLLTVHWQDGTWMASPGGGGIMFLLDNEQLKLLHQVTEQDVAPWRESGFMLEGGTDLWPVRGYHQRFRWNGWAKPAFEQDVVKAILEHMLAGSQPHPAADEGSWSFDKATDTFTALFPGQDEEERESWRGFNIRVEIPGLGTVQKHVYDVGSGCWTWDEEDEGYRTLRLLRDISALWDEHGFGDDDRVSEPLVHRLRKEIECLQNSLQ